MNTSLQRTTRKTSLVLLLLGAFVALIWTPVAVSDDGETKVTLATFQEHEVVPNTPLANGQEIPGSEGELKRNGDTLEAHIKTYELPPGAYSIWWHLAHDDGEVSILWAGSHIVDDSGELELETELQEGEANAPGAIFIGHGLQVGATEGVDAELWIRLHGDPSSDSALLFEQLNTPFGLCTDSRNPTPRPGIDYPCWNPQRAQFGPGVFVATRVTVLGKLTTTWGRIKANR